MRHFIGWSLLAGFLLATLNATAQQAPYLHAPAVNEYARHDPGGTTILPDGRLLEPIGKHLPLAKWPHGMVLSRDGKTVFVASDGVGQIINDWDGPTPTVAPIQPLENGAARRKSN